MRHCRRIWTIGCSCLTSSNTSWVRLDPLPFTSPLSLLQKNSFGGYSGWSRKGCWLRQLCWPIWRLRGRRLICIISSRMCSIMSIWPRIIARWYWYGMTNGVCRYVPRRIRLEVIERRAVWFPPLLKFTLTFSDNSLILWTIMQFY